MVHPDFLQKNVLTYAIGVVIFFTFVLKAYFHHLIYLNYNNLIIRLIDICASVEESPHYQKDYNVC